MKCEFSTSHTVDGGEESVDALVLETVGAHLAHKRALTHRSVYSVRFSIIRATQLFFFIAIRMVLHPCVCMELGWGPSKNLIDTFTKLHCPHPLPPPLGVNTFSLSTALPSVIGRL